MMYCLTEQYKILHLYHQEHEVDQTNIGQKKCALMKHTLTYIETLFPISTLVPSSVTYRTPHRTPSPYQIRRVAGFLILVRWRE